jgi:biotin operon repressor
MNHPGEAQQEYFSIAELAQRWRCSRGTVYNRLRALGAEVLDFASRGKKGKKVVRTPIATMANANIDFINSLTCSRDQSPLRCANRAAKDSAPDLL